MLESPATFGAIVAGVATSLLAFFGLLRGGPTFGIDPQTAAALAIASLLGGIGLTAALVLGPLAMHLDRRERAFVASLPFAFPDYVVGVGEPSRIVSGARIRLVFLGDAPASEVVRDVGEGFVEQVTKAGGRALVVRTLAPDVPWSTRSPDSVFALRSLRAFTFGFLLPLHGERPLARVVLER